VRARAVAYIQVTISELVHVNVTIFRSYCLRLSVGMTAAILESNQKVQSKNAHLPRTNGWRTDGHKRALAASDAVSWSLSFSTWVAEVGQTDRQKDGHQTDALRLLLWTWPA